MVWCATHDPDVIATFWNDRFLSRLTRILRERSQPLETVMYESVMEALKPEQEDPPLLYESSHVQEAFETLMRKDWFEAMRLDMEQAWQIRGAYHKVLDERALQFASKWLQRGMLMDRETPLWQRTLHALLAERRTDVTDLTVSNLATHEALNCPRTRAAVNKLASAGSDDQHARTMGFSMACFAAGATCALSNVDFCRFGPLYSTIDAYSERYMQRTVPAKSTSRAIIRAFDKCSDEPLTVARRWIEAYYKYADKNVRHTALTIACVSFQMALGLTDGNGLDYCYEQRFAEGLRQVLLTARAEMILESLPQAAPLVVPPETIFIMFNAQQQALQIRDLTYGAIWGLKAMEHAEV